MNKFYLIIAALLYSGLASASDGDVKKQTVDGIEWTYTILNEADKTCSVGGVETDYWGDTSGIPAIDKNTTGAISIPMALDGYSVVAVCEEAFRESMISSAVIPSSITRIDEKAFFRCENLISVTLSEGLTFIGEEVFSDCPISTIELPQSLVRIGEQAFENTKLTTIFIPKNVAFLGNEDWINDYGEEIEEDDLYGDIFNSCELLAEVKVDVANETYADIDGILVTKDKKVLLYFPAAKNDAVIPEGIEEICEECFEYSKLTTISLPSTLSLIGEYAFAYSALTSIAIGNEPLSAAGSYAPKRDTSSQQSITIRSDAFYCCSDLKTIILGDNISEIQSSAFGRCESLTDVYTFSTTPQTIDQDTFVMDYEPDENWMNWYPVCTATLHVPAGCKASYEAAEGWNIFKEIVEDTQTTGISTTPATTSHEDSPYFDLMGCKAKPKAPGIYVKNGKKIVIK